MTKGFKKRFVLHYVVGHHNVNPHTTNHRLSRGFPNYDGVLLSLLTDEMFCFNTIFTMFGGFESAFPGSNSKLLQLLRFI